MRLSPRVATVGFSRRICARLSSPEARVRALGKRTRPRISALATWTRRRVWSRSGRCPGRSETRTSRIDVGRSASGWARTSPRPRSATSRPARLTATRVPALARWTSPPWTWRLRARALRPEGRTSISSPSARLPATRVPVAIVPKPRSVKTRSTGRRRAPASERGAAPRASSRRAVRLPAARHRCATRRGPSARRRETIRPRAVARRSRPRLVSRRRPDRTSSAPPGREGSEGAGRCRSALGSAASRTRRPPPRA